MAEKKDIALTPELEKHFQALLEEHVAKALAALDVHRPQTKEDRSEHGGRSPLSVCPICRQQVSGCKGQHVRMVVYPRDPQSTAGFRGIHVNGVEYQSDGPDHYIDVPANSDVAALLAQYETAEMRSRRNNGNFENGRRNRPKPTYL